MTSRCDVFVVLKSPPCIYELIKVHSEADWHVDVEEAAGEGRAEGGLKIWLRLGLTREGRGVRLRGRNGEGPEGPDTGSLIRLGLKTPRYGVGKSNRRQLGPEEKATDRAPVLRWGCGWNRGLAQPGASLADAVADWMRGPPLIDCCRLELCVPGRPKPPLCLAASLSLL